MIWKEYGKTIRKLWLNLFGAAVFGFMLSSIAIFFAEKNPEHALTVYIIGGVIGTFFYAYLIYLAVWEVGAKDRIRVDGGRLDARPHQGLKIGLIFALPMIISGGIYLLISVLRESLSVSSGFLNAVSNVSAMIAYILAMPYVGFALALFGQLGRNIAETGQTLAYSVYLFATSFPAILFIWGTYLCGYHGKLMSRAFKPKKKDER